MKSVRKPVANAVAIAVASSGIFCSVHSWAATETDTQAEIKALRQQVELLMKKVETLSNKEAAAAEKQEKLEKQVAVVNSSGASAISSPLKNLDFYGNLDLSLDVATKGIAGKIANDGVSTPAGKVGWLPAISTNISYLGIRGKHDLGSGTAAVFQLETQLDISATAGTSNNNSSNDSTVKGALTSRNSYLGVEGSWGALKIGKTDAPLKNSTSRLNPFLGTVGDYSAIVGNSGGDNRVEFGTRLDHAIWYESPKMNGFTLNALWSPGQNRSSDNSIQAIGESSCAGGNVPGSGALPYGCNDGSYGDARSFSAAYDAGPLYVSAAYEIHKKVNRTSDADGTMVTFNGINYTYDNAIGIADESAWRVAAQYKLPTQTTIGALYEDLRRKLPYHYFDERSRKAYWLLVSQNLTPNDVVHFGWGHADKSPGSLGEHNINTTPDADNASNMYSLMYRHSLDKQTSWYLVYATQINHAAGHYDLGAGGRANTTDCHDGSQIAGGTPDLTSPGGGPFCYTGGKLQALSVGMSFKF
jgi:predicted porin